MLKIPLSLCFLYGYGRTGIVLFIQIFFVTIRGIHFDELCFDGGIGHFCRLYIRAFIDCHADRQPFCVAVRGFTLFHDVGALVDTL